MFKRGELVTLRGGGKIETLLSSLALRNAHRMRRDALLHTLWPDVDRSLAGQSLNTLVYTLHRALGDAMGGAPPVVREDQLYRLNVEAGIELDTAHFEGLVQLGQDRERSGRFSDAAAAYTRAINAYTGDLCVEFDLPSVLERERLRALYLTALAQLANHHHRREDYSACLTHAQALLAYDPCREDAHRLVMRCYAHRGERAQALRQYRLCEEILRREFDAVPEPATRALYDQIRLSPGDL